MPRPLTDWQDEIAAEMLEDLESITGVSIGEMLADDLAANLPPETSVEPSEHYEIYRVYEEPTESEEIDLDSEAGDTADYFDALFDDIEVDPDEQDAYGDE